jgi:hypothetical protein
MSWLTKQLKRTTKILDPIGNKLRKSTGGSYGDPLNQYQSHPPGVAQSSYAPKTRELMPAPNGQNTLGSINIGGGNTGGHTYAPNPFQAQMAQAQAIRQQPMGGQIGGGPMGAPIGIGNTMMGGKPQMPGAPMGAPPPAQGAVKPMYPPQGMPGQMPGQPMPYRGGNPKAMMFG